MEGNLYGSSPFERSKVQNESGAYKSQFALERFAALAETVKRIEKKVEQEKVGPARQPR